MFEASLIIILAGLNIIVLAPPVHNLIITIRESSKGKREKTNKKKNLSLSQIKPESVG